MFFKNKISYLHYNYPMRAWGFLIDKSMLFFLDISLLSQLLFYGKAFYYYSRV